MWPSERPTVRYIYDQCQPYWSCRPLMHPSTTGAFIRVSAHPPAHLLTSVHPTRATLRRRTPVRRPRRPSSAPIPTTFEPQNPAMHENPLSRAIRPHTRPHISKPRISFRPCSAYCKLHFRVISGWAKTACPSTHSFDGGRRWTLGGGERGGEGACCT